MRRLLCVALVVGCGGGKAKPDAAIVIDGAPDAAVDAPPDAPPDVMIPDALPQGEPQCMTAPTTLIDTSPRRISTIANVGDVLYVGTFDPNVQTEGEVLSLDPTTGTPVAPTLVIGAGASVWPASDAAYAAENTPDGSIWRLVAGQDPVELVTGRPSPLVVTSDGTYVYWTENNPAANQPEVVQRRAIAGGPIEQVIGACAHPYRLVVDATDLYCLEFQSGSVRRAPKDGSAAAALVPYGGGVGGGYPAASLIQDGANLYLANLYNNPQIWGAPKPGGPFTLVTQSPDLGRYLGLAASPGHFYASNQEGVIERIDRTNHSVVSIPILDHVNYGTPTGDPVIWNNQLFVVASNYTDPGNRLVLHCID